MCSRAGAPTPPPRRQRPRLVERVLAALARSPAPGPDLELLASACATLVALGAVLPREATCELVGHLEQGLDAARGPRTGTPYIPGEVRAGRHA